MVRERVSFFLHSADCQRHKYSRRFSVARLQRWGEFHIQFDRRFKSCTQCWTLTCHRVECAPPLLLNIEKIANATNYSKIKYKNTTNASRSTLTLNDPKCLFFSLALCLLDNVLRAELSLNQFHDVLIWFFSAFLAMPLSPSTTLACTSSGWLLNFYVFYTFSFCLFSLSSEKEKKRICVWNQFFFHINCSKLFINCTLGKNKIEWNMKLL